MKQHTKKLHVKLTVLYTCFAVLLGVFISVFGYRIMWNQATAYYSEKAEQIAALGAACVDGDQVGRYLQTMETDAAYDRTKAELSKMKQEFNVYYLYAFVPDSDSFTYLMEAQLETDDPALISTLGDVFEYTELEYTYLVPDVAAKSPSEEAILSRENFFFGDVVSAWHPVFDSRGELAAMVEADISLERVAASIRNSLVLMLAVYLALIVVMVLFQFISIRRMITAPLKKLTDRTLKFAAEGDLSDYADDIRTGDELQTLSEAFRQMARDIATYTEERADLAAEQERIATELEVATDIQQSMLPGELGDFPGRKYLDIRGRLHASQKMGGSFYDYFVLDDHRVGIVLCSMDGTGIPAAMLLVVTRTIIKSQFSGYRPLADTMGEINRQVFDSMDSKRPVSAFVGVLDTQEGVLSYINAGYNPPVIMRRGERYELLAGAASIPLGIERNVVYRDLKLELSQGDRLLFYSNGIVEARSSNGEVYGTERLRARLNETRGTDFLSGKLVDSVAAAVAEFTGKTIPDTDLVLLAMEYKRGNRDLARLSLPPEMGQVQELLEFLREQMAANGIIGKDYARILVCAEELFVICCKYAMSGRVEVDCAVPAPDRLELRFAADFRGVDPLSEQAGDVVKNAVAFIRENAEHLELERRDGRSALVMTKRLRQAQTVLAAVL